MQVKFGGVFILRPLTCLATWFFCASTPAAAIPSTDAQGQGSSGHSSHFSERFKLFARRLLVRAGRQED